MSRITYQVIKEFDGTIQYDFQIYPRYRRCLSSFKKGQKFSPTEFIHQNINKFTPNEAGFEATENIVCSSIGIAKKLGLICEIPSEPLSFKEFCKYETIQYCSSQLKGSSFKNLKPKPSQDASTRGLYLYRLWHFNNWLIGKNFEFSKLVQTGIDTFQKQTISIKLESLEHLLKLYQSAHQSENKFARMIKEYLMDDSIHKGKKESTIRITMAAIKSYFETNDSPIQFRFNAKATYQSTSEDDDQPSLTLADLLQILTVGKPSVTEKAVFLCKFHRGLDNSTLADRFNYQAWDQLVDYFRTGDYTKWDVEKCPVPIKLTRVKTDYPHLGFLDRDAIESLQIFLKYRYEKTGSPINKGDALFINKYFFPITSSWVNRKFTKLARVAGIQRKLDSYSVAVRYEKDSHELRDLLKSTLIVCGTRYDVSDHVIGHKPKDSYEKQSKLYPDSLRSEYAKASRKLNIFSNLATNMQSIDDIESLKIQLKELKEENEKFKLELLRQLEIKYNLK